MKTHNMKKYNMRVIQNEKNKLKILKKQLAEYTTFSNLLGYILAFIVYLLFVMIVLLVLTWFCIDSVVFNMKVNYWLKIMELAIHGCGKTHTTLQRVFLKQSSFNTIPSCADVHVSIENLVLFLVKITIGSFFGTTTFQKITPYIWYSIRLYFVTKIGKRCKDEHISN